MRFPAVVFGEHHADIDAHGRDDRELGELAVLAQSILDHHRDPLYDTSDDCILVVNVERKSKRFGAVYPLDLGNGNYPLVLEKRDYWKNDPRAHTLTLTLVGDAPPAPAPTPAPAPLTTSQS